MASATKKKNKSKSTKKSSGSSKSSSAARERAEEAKAEFERKQNEDRAAQALSDPNAVPEQRPQAFAESRPDLQSEENKRRREAGAFDPMPMSAHVKASSDAQLEKAEDEEKELGNETLREGARVLITGEDHIYKGSEGAVVEVEYDGFEEKQKAMCGDPSVARFARAASYMVRTRGHSHALVSVKPDEVERIDQLHGTDNRGA